MNSYKKLIGAVSLIAFASIASAATIKLGHVDGADWQTSKKGVEGFKRFSGIEVDGQLIEQKFLENYPL